MSEDQKADATPKSLAKETVTTIAGFTALCYVLGFIIINAFLISYGLVTHSLLNNKYLAAGICFTFFYVLAGLIFVIIPGRGSPADEWDSMVAKRNAALETSVQKKLAALPPDSSEGFKTGYERGFRAMYGVSFTFGYGIGYLIRIFVLQLHYYLLFLLLSLGIFYITASKVSLAVSHVMILWTVIVTLGTALGVDLWKRGLAETSRLMPWFLVLVMISAVFYGSRIYPEISPSIGGGIPIEVVFVVSDEDKDEIETVLDVALLKNQTPKLKLLLETSESFVIAVERGDSQRICQLKKDLVKGIIHKTSASSL